jgi:hypothetical protein
MKIQKDNSLSFLDVLISRLHYGSLTHKVYRKPTHIDQYIHALSHHYPTQKSTILKTLTTRAIWISSPQFLEEEKDHMTKAFMTNGYSVSHINKYFFSAWNLKPKNPPPNSLPLSHLSLPYIKGTTDIISKIMTKMNIKTFFKPCKTLKKLFKTVNDKSDNMMGTRFYQIPCSRGKSYIGQTRRSLKS